MADIAHRHAGLWALDSLNGNCGSTAQWYLERTSADVCLLQEMRYRAAEVDQASRTASRSGWALSVGAAADKAADSTSAGVAVAVRSCLGMALPYPIDAVVNSSRVCV